MGIFDKGAATALNHLLAREQWAREKLAPFAGEVVELRLAPMLPVRLSIVEGGYTTEAPASSDPTLTLSAKPEIFAALSKGEEHLMRAVDISGNASLATEILALLRYLRWDVEEDLSRVIGDVLAHRVVGTARQLAAWQADAGRRLAENVMEYAIEERRLIVPREEFDVFAANVATLRDDLDRLEQRVERRRQSAESGTEPYSPQR
jgi:ubiquinone biosynthesis protein UbiJ